MGEELPDFLTVEEAARILRIGRTAAYEQAKVWRRTKGAAGLQVIEVGNSLRVPVTFLERQLGRPLRAIPPRDVGRDGSRGGDTIGRPKRPGRRDQRRPSQDAQGVLPL